MLNPFKGNWSEIVKDDIKHKFGNLGWCNSWSNIIEGVLGGADSRDWADKEFLGEKWQEAVRAKRDSCSMILITLETQNRKREVSFQ